MEVLHFSYLYHISAYVHDISAILYEYHLSIHSYVYPIQVHQKR